MRISSFIRVELTAFGLSRSSGMLLGSPRAQVWVSGPGSPTDVLGDLGQRHALPERTHGRRRQGEVP
jgi:hypothetical protein